MNKETKIELLKIFGMIVILVALIFGIVWLNKIQDVSANETTTSTEETETINEESANENAENSENVENANTENK